MIPSNPIFVGGTPLCLKCGKQTVPIKEYAKGHFSFFCKDCKEWKYIP